MNSNEELEHWKNSLHEVSMLCCNMMTKSLSCVSTEVRNILHYGALDDVSLLLDKFEGRCQKSIDSRHLSWRCVLH